MVEFNLIDSSVPLVSNKQPLYDVRDTLVNHSTVTLSESAGVNTIWDYMDTHMDFAVIVSHPSYQFSTKEDVEASLPYFAVVSGTWDLDTIIKGTNLTVSRIGNNDFNLKFPIPTGVELDSKFWPVKVLMKTDENSDILFYGFGVIKG